MSRRDERPHVVGGRRAGGLADFGLAGLLLVLVLLGLLVLGGVYVVGQWQAARTGAVYTGDLLANIVDVGQAWTPALDSRQLWVTSAGGLTGLAVLVLVTVIVAAGRRGHHREVRWATAPELKGAGLTVKRPEPGRLIVGTVGRKLVAAPRGHSLIVFGPPGSGKTAGVAVPALLEWDGPAVVSTVKPDLERITREEREERGQTMIYDPLDRLEHPARCGWNPIELCDSYEAAQALAGAFMSLSDFGNMDKGDFWQSSAKSLLAPLLLAAHRGSTTIREVRRWLNLNDWEQPAAFLVDDPEAAESLVGATKNTPKDTALSYVATARVALSAYETPAAVESTLLRPQVDLDRLLDGQQTLYLMGDEDDQRILRPLFVGLLDAILRHAARRVGKNIRAARPLLVLLDEAANSAPLPDLARYASVVRDRGVELVTIWQDLGQVHERYGEQSARTIVNNHQAKMLLPGASDRELLEYMSRLLGEERIRQHSTGGQDGRLNESETFQPLVSPDELRRLRQGQAVFVHGASRPATVKIRPYYEQRQWRGLADRWQPADQPSPDEVLPQPRTAAPS